MKSELIDLIEELTTAEIEVLLLLEHEQRTNKVGKAVLPKQWEICDRTGRTEKRIREAYQGLEEKGILNITTPSNPWSAPYTMGDVYNDEFQTFVQNLMRNKFATKYYEVSKDSSKRSDIPNLSTEDMESLLEIKNVFLGLLKETDRPSADQFSSVRNQLSGIMEKRKEGNSTCTQHEKKIKIPFELAFRKTISWQIIDDLRRVEDRIDEAGLTDREPFVTFAVDLCNTLDGNPYELRPTHVQFPVIKQLEEASLKSAAQSVDPNPVRRLGERLATMAERLKRGIFPTRDRPTQDSQER